MESQQEGIGATLRRSFGSGSGAEANPEELQAPDTGRWLSTGQLIA